MLVRLAEALEAALRACDLNIRQQLSNNIPGKLVVQSILQLLCLALLEVDALQQLPDILVILQELVSAQNLDGLQYFTPNIVPRICHVCHKLFGPCLELFFFISVPWCRLADILPPEAMDGFNLIPLVMVALCLSYIRTCVIMDLDIRDIDDLLHQVAKLICVREIRIDILQKIFELRCHVDETTWDSVYGVQVFSPR